MQAERCWTQPRGGRGDARPKISPIVDNVVSGIRHKYPEHAFVPGGNETDNSDHDDEDSQTYSFGDVSGSSIDSDDDINDDDFFNLRDIINADEIRDAISDLPPQDPSRKSYEALLGHECWPKQCDPRWQPFPNILFFMLWLGWGNTFLFMLYLRGILYCIVCYVLFCDHQ